MPTDPRVIEHLAREVMDWHVEWRRESPGVGHDCWYDKDNHYQYPCVVWDPLQEDHTAQIFEPGGVVDAMLAKGWLFRLDSPGPCIAGWEADFYMLDDEDEWIHVKVEDPDKLRAVCEAAFNATGGEE